MKALYPLLLCLLTAGCGSTLTTKISVYGGETAPLNAVDAPDALAFARDASSSADEILTSCGNRARDSSATIQGLRALFEKHQQRVAQVTASPAFRETAKKYVEAWAAYVEAVYKKPGDAASIVRTNASKLRDRKVFSAEGYAGPTLLLQTLGGQLRAKEGVGSTFLQFQRVLCLDDGGDCETNRSEFQGAIAKLSAQDRDKDKDALHKALLELKADTVVWDVKTFFDNEIDATKELARDFDKAAAACQSPAMSAAAVRVKQAATNVKALGTPQAWDAKEARARLAFLAAAAQELAASAQSAQQALQEAAVKIEKLRLTVEEWSSSGYMPAVEDVAPTLATKFSQTGGRADLDKTLVDLGARLAQVLQGQHLLERTDWAGRKVGTPFLATDRNLAIITHDDNQANWREITIDAAEVDSGGKSQIVLVQDGPLTFRVREIQSDTTKAGELGITVADVGVQLLSVVALKAAGIELPEGDDGSEGTPCQDGEMLSTELAQYRTQIVQTVADMRKFIEAEMSTLPKDAGDKAADPERVQRIKGKLDGYKARLIQLRAAASSAKDSLFCTSGVSPSED